MRSLFFPQADQRPSRKWQAKIARSLSLFLLLIVCSLQSPSSHIISTVYAQDNSAYTLINPPGVSNFTGGSGNEFSGVTYSATSNTLFIADDGTPTIFEYTLNGSYVRAIDIASVVTGSADLEAISWMYSNRFVVGNEQDGKLYVIDIPAGNNVSISSSIYVVDTGIVEDSGTFGLEGIAYESTVNGVDRFYVLDQQDAAGDPRIHQFRQDGTQISSFTIQGSPVDNGSGLHYSSSQQSLFVVSSENNDENNQVLKLTLTGAVEWSHSISAFGKPEGITFMPDLSEMIVVGEERQFARYSHNNPISNQPPAYANTGAQVNVIGSFVSLTIATTDGDDDTLTYSAENLPLGLDINTATGEISGTPTAEAISQVTVTVDDGQGEENSISTVQFTWTIVPAYDGDALPTEGPLKVAFTGDQGVNADAAAVLNLINSEGADMLLIQGDLGYESNTPQSWEQQLTNSLGADFPVFSSIGNHDTENWATYEQLLTNRLNLIPDATCVGQIGVQAACHYKGLFFVQVAPGLIGSGHDTYLLEQLTNDNSLWSICSWHLNQQMMQVGGKSDQAGWDVYEACRNGGGIAATAHEHSYSRTYLMDGFEDLSVASTADPMTITQGETFGFVSGLGGQSIRPQLLGGNHWASIYTANQGANHGALFCTFYADGQADKATCYFKDIDGNVPDQFTLISDVQADGPGNEGPFTLTRSITSSTDDAEEISSTTQMYLDSSDLELVNDSDRGDQAVGIRFRNITIPPGATIMSAQIAFTVDENGSSTTNLMIHGEASADPAAYTSTAQDIENRDRTAASVPWTNLPPWSTNQVHKTPELASIVQEIVDANGWSSGNSMAFIVSGSGRRTAESFDGDSTEAPRLEITYAPPPSVIMGDVNCDGIPDAVDAMLILQFAVEMRTDSGGCPLNAPDTTLNHQGGDVNADTVVDAVDALTIAQCTAGFANTFCPAE